MSRWLRTLTLLTVGFLSGSVGYSIGSRRNTESLRICIATVAEDIDLMAQASKRIADMRTVVEACAYRPMMEAEDLQLFGGSDEKRKAP